MRHTLALCDVGAATDPYAVLPCVEPNAHITVIYFSYSGTSDWLKIEWRDQLCMNLKEVLFAWK